MVVEHIGFEAAVVGSTERARWKDLERLGFGVGIVGWMIVHKAGRTREALMCMPTSIVIQDQEARGKWKS